MTKVVKPFIRRGDPILLAIWCTSKDQGNFCFSVHDPFKESIKLAVTCIRQSTVSGPWRAQFHCNYQKKIIIIWHHVEYIPKSLTIYIFLPTSTVVEKREHVAIKTITINPDHQPVFRHQNKILSKILFWRFFFPFKKIKCYIKHIFKRKINYYKWLINIQQL